MYKRNDSLTGDQILQNQFTAFLNTALCNTRKAYLRGKYRRCKREYITDEFLRCPYDDGYIESTTDYAELYAALSALREKERRVFLSRVISEKSFDEIARELGLSYKGATAIYYRTIAKLRVLLGGEYK
ncbi:MAG TPA: sigma-70 family RNA polymerase sigma factor [Candidatus Fimivicinus intestinavium]|nr:sigma-70 family RNA polymerase sigma factor [Candidatus Fimivicinus intestinavium]